MPQKAARRKACATTVPAPPAYGLLVLLLGLVLSSGCSPGRNVEAGAPAGSPEDEVVAFTNVHVVPMDTERILDAHTVVVRDGTIAAVGPSAAVEVPAGARVIDGQGAYLLPGLTDVHVHLRSTDELLSYLAYGVTTIVHMSGATSGAPDLLRYRAELAAGERVGPRLFTTGPILDGDPPIFGGVSIVVTTPDAARRVVAEQKAAGYDLIKVYNNLMPDVLDAVTDAADAHGLPVAGHIPRAGGRGEALQRALAAGLDLIAHGEEYYFTYFYGGVDSLLDRGELPYPDTSRIPEPALSAVEWPALSAVEWAVRMTREAGAAVTPNLSFVAMTRRQLDDLEAVLTDPEMRYLHPDVRAMWDAQNPTRRPDLERFDRREQAKYAFLQRLTKALHEGGVPLLLGTDASAPGVFPGRSAHLELSELVAAGLTPFEALATGTRNPGTFIREHIPEAEPFGLVAPGHRADLILVTGNPLEDVGRASEVMGVMARGQWRPAAELEAMREDIAASYAR